MNLDIRICLEFSALSLGFNLEIASALTCLAMTKRGGHCEPFSPIIASPHYPSLRAPYLSLRAEGVAIPAKSKLKNQNAK